jgi:hypothetical protein
MAGRVTKYLFERVTVMAVERGGRNWSFFGHACRLVAEAGSLDSAAESAHLRLLMEPARLLRVNGWQYRSEQHRRLRVSSPG